MIAQCRRASSTPDLRRLPIEIAALATFALVPFWLRMPYAAGTYDPAYAFGFAITIPLLATLAAWALAGLPGLGDLRHDPPRMIMAIGLAGIALWAWMSVGWSFMAGSGQINVAQSAAARYTLAAGWTLAVLCAGPTPRAVISVLIVSVAAQGGIGIAQTIAQGSIGLGALGEFTFNSGSPRVSFLQSGDLRYVRPYGLLQHPNIFAGVLCAGLIACAGWIGAADRRLRAVGIAFSALILLALLLTFSRSAWLGVAAGAFTILPRLTRRRDLWRPVAIAVGVALVVGTGFASRYVDLLIARVAISEATEVRSINERALFSELAFRALAENRQNQIFGIGVGNFPWRASYYMADGRYFLRRGDNVHQVWLYALVETGAVGFALLLVMICAGVEGTLRNLRADRGLDRAALVAIALALGVIGLFDHYPWTMLQFKALWWGALAVGARPPCRDAQSSSSSFSSSSSSSSSSSGASIPNGRSIASSASSDSKSSSDSNSDTASSISSSSASISS
jgi:O-antigen ligase